MNVRMLINRLNEAKVSDNDLVSVRIGNEEYLITCVDDSCNVGMLNVCATASSDVYGDSFKQVLRAEGTTLEQVIAEADKYCGKHYGK